jgi:hypothetical protein
VQETLEERRLDWLGNVARQTDTNIPKRLLTAWISKPRNNCGQKLSLGDSNAAAINRIGVQHSGISLEVLGSVGQRSKFMEDFSFQTPEQHTGPQERRRSFGAERVPRTMPS